PSAACKSSVPRLALPSFPTRRSSDLCLVIVEHTSKISCQSRAQRLRKSRVGERRPQHAIKLRGHAIRFVSHLIPCIEIPRCFPRSEEHTSELQSRENLVCRLLLSKQN